MNWAQVWLIIRKLYHLGPLWPMIVGSVFMVTGEMVIVTTSFTENLHLGQSVGLPLMGIGAALMLLGLYWMARMNRLERPERLIRH